MMSGGSANPENYFKWLKSLKNAVLDKYNHGF